MEETTYRTRLEHILGVPLAEDVVRQWPQSGELIRGRARIAEVESHFEGLRLGVGRRLACGDIFVVEERRLRRRPSVPERYDCRTAGWKGDPRDRLLGRAVHAAGVEEGVGRTHGYDNQRCVASGRHPSSWLTLRCEEAPTRMQKEFTAESKALRRSFYLSLTSAYRHRELPRGRHFIPNSGRI
jgi:hypothetical protein